VGGLVLEFLFLIMLKSDDGKKLEEDLSLAGR
jgi:hypothetical protein